MGYKHGPAVDRFAEKVALADSGCIEWIASLNNRGYGTFTTGGRTVVAHRWSYEHHVGPIPDGFQLDYLCENRACVNPSHLQLQTKKSHGSLHAAERTHCLNGHPFDAENTRDFCDAGPLCVISRQALLNQIGQAFVTCGRLNTRM